MTTNGSLLSSIFTVKRFLAEKSRKNRCKYGGFSGKLDVNINFQFLTLKRQYDAV